MEWQRHDIEQDQGGCKCVDLTPLFSRMRHLLGKDVEGILEGFTKKQLGAAMDLLEKMEMNYILALLLGGPGENRQTVEETVEFLEPRTPFFLDFCVGIRIMPHTDMRDIAVREGIISPDDSLIEPRFYCSADIKEWIESYLREVCSRHSNWTVAHTLE